MNRSVQEVIDKNKCSGCFLCMNICPLNCIKIELNQEGFYNPQIDSEKCSNCGICLKKCPVYNQSKINEYYEIQVYMAKSLDNDLKISSSSGGIFGELAKHVIMGKGIVYGALFNEKKEVIHMGVEKKNDLDKLIGSKYLQSYIGFTYKDIKENLLKNKPVLFVGLPCQVNALKNYIGNNQDLILVDLICHGVPSRVIFDKYLKGLFGDEVIKKFDFRDKKSNRDWENFKIRIEGDSSIYLRSHRKDAFFYGYLKNLYLNDICYACPFSQIPRVSDITLGDYWGVPEKLKDKEGTSLVVTNSLKGKDVMHKLYNSKRIQLIETDIGIASRNNPRLIEGEMNIPMEREKIFNNIDKFSFKEMDNLFIKSFDDNVYRNFVNIIKHKKIIVFGTGSALDKILSTNQLIKIENISYLLDNDIKKQGSAIHGKMIYSVEKLKQENITDIFIVVASSYYEEICGQLKNFELKENVDYIDGIKYLIFD